MSFAFSCWAVREIRTEGPGMVVGNGLTLEVALKEDVGKGNNEVAMDAIVLAVEGSC